MDPLVIGIAGRARSGKDFTAKAILGHFPGGRRLAFADELKREINGLTGLYGNARNLFKIISSLWDSRVPFWVHFDEYAPLDELCLHGKQRTLLQWWGWLRRQQDPMYWINKVAKNIPECRYVLITDMRYPNEMEWVKERGGVTVRVKRPDYQPDPADNAAHISETALDDVVMDYELVVNSPSQLQTRAITLFEEICHARGIVLDNTTRQAVQ